ncbi:hypothetical protein BH11ARM2_BH11ARM2_08030 [soil metagenome]
MRSDERLDALDRAVASLSEFCASPITERRDVAGVLMALTYCYDLCWKCLQDEVVRNGLSERGPRLVAQASFRLGLLQSDEAEIWQELADDRNRISHTYDSDWAIDALPRICGSHLPLLQKMVPRLQALT